MAVIFELPPDIEQRLQRELADLGQTAKEATLIELYRQGQITHPDLSRGLGLSRLETEAVLKRHHVTEDLPSAEEHSAALTRMRTATGQ